MTFADRLETLLQKATPDEHEWRYGLTGFHVEGRDAELFLFLRQNAPALLALVKASQDIIDYDGDEEFDQAMNGLRQALRNLEGE